MATKGDCEALFYGNDDVSGLLNEGGYPPFSGHYNDLSNKPELCALPCYGDVQVTAYLTEKGDVAADSN